MPLVPKLWDRTGGALLMRAGAAGRLTTVGRRSGQERTVQCGFLGWADGSVLVGSAADRQWPQNLLVAGCCTFEANGLPARRYTAAVLEGAERTAAIAEFRAARGDRAAAMF